MSQRATSRRRQPGAAPAGPEQLGRDNPVLALQRSIGNRAVAQMISREPTRTGSVAIPGVGTVKVKGGNLEEWAGKGAPDWVEVTSEKGKHSDKLEKLATARTKQDIKVQIGDASKAGEELNVGGGTQLEIEGARITGYSVADGVETWRISDFTNVKRTKITHRIGSG
jgi:hypothetical protein